MAITDAVRNWIVRILSAIGVVFDLGRAIASAEIHKEQVASFTANPNVALTPAEAAAAYVKGWLDFDNAAANAVESGVKRDRFQTLTDTTGNPPGPIELIQLWRLGLIDEPTVDQGIKEGLIRNEWITALKGLRYLPISAEQAVEADVQHAMDSTEAQAVAAMNGTAQHYYEILYRLAGNPPGPQELLTMWDRGIIDESLVDHGLQQSRLKDEWIPAFKELRRRRIPMRTINTLLAHGTITDAVALQDLLDLGFDQADAEALIKTATAGASKAAKAETVGQITALYSTHVITEAQAVQHLETLGYPPEVAAELLHLGDARAVLQLQNQAVSALRTRFVGHRIDEATARADLLAAGLDEAKITALLVLWKIEQTANPRELTEAQLRAAVKAGVLTVDQYTARLVGMGYTGGDASILAQTHFPTPGG